MANVKTGNSYYVDSTGVLTTDACKLLQVVVTATAASAVVLLRDGAGTNNKADLRVATSGESVVFDFTANPIVCPAGLKVQTLTNAILLVVYTQ